MMVGIFVYNFIPTDVTVAKPSTYEVSSDTTKVLSDIPESEKALSSITGSSSSTSSTPTTTIVLQTYEITKSDLAIYKAEGEYVSGKSDPFADAITSSDNTDDNSQSSGTSSGSTNSSSQSGSTSSNSSSYSDGTLLNSASKK
jgi:hypothetical protein